MNHNSYVTEWWGALAWEPKYALREVAEKLPVAPLSDGTPLWVALVRAGQRGEVRGLLREIRQAKPQICPIPLDQLPPDILRRIAQHLSLQDSLRVRCANRTLRSLFSGDDFFRGLAVRIHVKLPFCRCLEARIGPPNGDVTWETVFWRRWIAHFTLRDYRWPLDGSHPIGLKNGRGCCLCMRRVPDVENLMFLPSGLVICDDCNRTHVLPLRTARRLYRLDAAATQLSTWTAFDTTLILKQDAQRIALRQHGSLEAAQAIAGVAWVKASRAHGVLLPDLRKVVEDHHRTLKRESSAYWHFQARHPARMPAELLKQWSDVPAAVHRDVSKVEDMEDAILEDLLLLRHWRRKDREEPLRKRIRPAPALEILREITMALGTEVFPLKPAEQEEKFNTLIRKFAKPAVQLEMSDLRTLAVRYAGTSFHVAWLRWVASL